MKENNYDKTIIHTDLFLLQEVPNSTSKSDIVCYCPECENKVGKPDTTGKLYLTLDRSTGWCFRCHTAFTNKIEPINSTIEIDSSHYSAKIKRASDAILKKLTAKPIKLEPVQVSNIYPIDQEVLMYLIKRNPYLIHLMDFLGLKTFDGYKKGVYVPFLFDGTVAKYQIRFLNNPSFKYYTSAGTKIPYSPRHALFNLSTIPRVDTLTICEGVFDAIALDIMGYPNVFAVLGSSITEYQASILRMFMPERVNLAMDNPQLNQSIRDSIEGRLPSISKFKSLEFEGTDCPDPEEFLIQSIKKNPSLGRTYLENLKQRFK